MAYFFQLAALSIAASLLFVARCTADDEATATASSESTLSAAEQVELLGTVAASFERNQQALKTWRGEAGVIRKRLSDEGEATKTVTTAKVTFALDRPANRLMWTWTHEPESTTAGGLTTIKPHVKPYSSALVTEELFYRFPYGHADDNRAKNLPMSVTVFARDEQTIHSFNYDFDPLWYFTYNGEDLPARIRFLAELISSGDRRWSVTKRGDVVTLETRREGLLNRYRFSLANGGNPVSYHGSDGQALAIYHWSYEQRGDVWLPATWSLYHVENGEPQFPGRALEIRTAEVKFKTTEINEELPKGAFTLSALGMQPGDIVLDNLTDGRIIYHGEQTGD